MIKLNKLVTENRVKRQEMMTKKLIIVMLVTSAAPRDVKVRKIENSHGILPVKFGTARLTDSTYIFLHEKEEHK